MELRPETHVADIATHHPGTVKIFQHHGIDYCCGGRRPLAEACTKSGADLDRVVADLEAELAGPPTDERNWAEEPMTALVVHIVEAYHQPLRELLPRIATMAERVLARHGEGHPEMVPPLVETFRDLREELETHMHKEEVVVFPYAKALERASGREETSSLTPFAALRGPVEVMEEEHARAGEALARMREVTGGFTPPEGACPTFRALLYDLAHLESEMHQHIHLENNVLFPRLEARARQLGLVAGS